MARCPYIPEDQIDSYVASTKARLDGNDRRLPDPRDLSPRQTKALELAAQGHNTPAIAEAMEDKTEQGTRVTCPHPV